MDPAEVEFLAEKEIVTVVPNFSQDKIYLIGGDVGPFSPTIPVDVPLWMAINLKQRQKCHIQAPSWMDVDKLEEKKEEEVQSKLFTEVPNKHYMELTQLLLKHAVDDIPRADEIRTLVKDIWDMRIAKLRSSLLDGFVNDMGNAHAKLNNVTVMELNTIRPFLTKAMGHKYMLSGNVIGTEGTRIVDD